MAKHARKKQRTSRASDPLGSVTLAREETQKDDEELRLENLLFGTDVEGFGKGKGREADLIVVSDEEESIEGDAGKEMERVQDTDVRGSLVALRSGSQTILSYSSSIAVNRPTLRKSQLSIFITEMKRLQTERKRMAPIQRSKIQAPRLLGRRHPRRPKPGRRPLG